MKASFLNKAGDVSIREIDVPTLDADQVLVRVESVGICGSDVHYYKQSTTRDKKRFTFGMIRMITRIKLGLVKSC